MEFDVWFLLPDLGQEILELRLRNGAGLGDVQVHKEIIEVKVVEIEGDSDLEECLIDELSNFSFIKISIIVKIIGLPDII